MVNSIPLKFQRSLLAAVCLGLPVFSYPSNPEFPSEQIQFFETSIRPLLAKNCLECHTGKKAKVGLELNHRAGWLKGSDYRKVIDLENSVQSIVIQAVSHAPAKDILPMPDEGEKLSDDEIQNLVRWIEMGLPWPESAEGRSTAPEDHWSFQPVKRSAVPEGIHPIDFFVQKAQKEAQVIPAPRADRATLYRRVHFNILGLPPKYAALKQFVDDPRPDADVWPELVRRLLTSQNYGERWARHWMDIARYSDTKGYEAGGRERRFVYSYTYRDWLIRSINEDLPYDQFLLYQLAADQLVDWNGPEKHHLAAMGFLSLSKNGKTELVIDDRIDTTFRGMMALTVACARCHDHKIDPISTKEYYSLYSVFANSLETRTPVIGEPRSGPEYEKYLAELAKKQQVIDDYLNPKFAKVLEAHPELKGRRTQLVAKLDRADRRELQNKQRVVDKFVADAGMEPDKAIALREKETPSGQAVFIRGNPSRRGETVKRQFPAIASVGEPQPYQKGAGRLEMAKDIAYSQNPFTARNIVNRIWMWHFGEGIVRTVDDFGIMGELPDHPELLDFLAHWFVENGWSLKKLHELILTSETWRQESSNAKTEENMLVDSENRLLWKFNRRRLDLEQLRDSILDISGSISDEMYGRAVKILEPPYSNRRSVYAFIDRQNLNPIFRNFDFSNPQESTGKRPNTTIPMQALFTLNSEFIQSQSVILAKNAKSQEDGIAYLHQQIFARPPADSDRILAESFLSAFASETEGRTQQTNTEWSYGYGFIDENAEVTFIPLPHWTGSAWQIGKERPVKDDPRSYLYADKGALHPGHTSKESFIYQWEAPADMTVSISGLAQRASVNKGNGVRLKIANSRREVLKDIVLKPSQSKIPMAIKTAKLLKGDRLFFIVEPHENDSSFDSVRWSPQVQDISGEWPKWGLAESFSGPATPATAWSAYAHALMNTNRFLFIE